MNSFKSLVKIITIMYTEEDYNNVCIEIDLSYQNEKITWLEHELLYELAGRISY